MFLSRVAAFTTLLAFACASNQPAPRRDPDDPNAVRYRLLLRENPVDSHAAFTCYGDCQSQRTPQGYLECLMQCPGFETTAGTTCSKTDVPPIAACFTARKVEADREVAPGYVVLAIVANMAIIVALASVCASSNTGTCNGASMLPPPK
jgi:hypothetical protein